MFVEILLCRASSNTKQNHLDINLKVDSYMNKGLYWALLKYSIKSFIFYIVTMAAQYVTD